MVRRLGVAVPDLGRHTAGDSTGLRGRLDPSETRRAGEVADGLPQASGGRKEYRDDDGTVTKVVEWFGYKLHLLVDVTHEVVLAFDITDTRAGDNERIEPLVGQAERNLPADRLETLAYDKAADDGAVHELLHDHDIKPVIQNRRCWPKDGGPGEGIGSRVLRPVAHDEAGTVYCYDTASPVPVRRGMSYAGHEGGRGTSKSRCPARVEGFPGGSDAACHAGTWYGMTVRVGQAIALRRLPSIPRATPPFGRRYNGRTAVERVNDRLAAFRGSGDGHGVGWRRFGAQGSAVLVIHRAWAPLLAKGQRTEGSFGTLRVSPIAKERDDLATAEKAAALA